MEFRQHIMAYLVGAMAVVILFLPSIRRYCFSMNPDGVVCEELPVTRSCPVKHLACVMDGNRRWAKNRGLPIIEGHRRGAETLRMVVEYALKHGIERLSVYAFSIENFKRSEDEKAALFEMIPRVLRQWKTFLCDNEICVRIIGDRSLFPATARASIDESEMMTKDNRRLHLDILFCYGAEQEAVAAAKSLARKVKEGEIDVDDITEQSFNKNLWTGDVPGPDLLIRTGCRRRLSNCLMLQCRYSEIDFMDRLWPDVTPKDLDKSIATFAEVNRSFGV